MFARSSKRITLARPGSVLVIDGFLRSGNTFSVAAFAVSKGRDCTLADTCTVRPHVLRAVRLGLPTIVHIRRPADAVASHLVRRPTLTPDDALREYLDFYCTAWRARDGFVVGRFDQVVSDFGSVLERVNRRYGTSFHPYVTSEQNEAAAFHLSRR
jgi:hypothetical protein